MFHPKTTRLLPRAVLGGLVPVLFLFFSAHSGAVSPPSNDPNVDPLALIQRVAANEMRANEARAAESQPFLRFNLYKENEKGTTTRQVIQTRDGTVTRLLSINGKSLTEEQEKEEVVRLQRLLDQPELQERRRRREQEDSMRANKMVKIMPQAFLYVYAGMVQGPCGPAIKLGFRPDPKFVPPDTESRIASGISGEVWIDRAQERMVRLDAKLTTDVDFGWGIVGRLYKGGSIVIEDTDVGNHNWQPVRLKLDLAGKALMLKTLSVRITENSTDFQPVARQTGFRDAIRLLLLQSGTIVQAPVH